MTSRMTTTAILVLILIATCAGAMALTITVDQARVKTTGANVDGVWNLWGNGDFGDFVHIEKPGVYQVRVACWGTRADGVWPWMGLSVDGELVENVVVAWATEKEHTFRFKAKPGDYRIAVSFSNDHKTATEDRNILISRMAIVAPAGAPDPTLSDQTKWQAGILKWQAKLEEDTLKRARLAIEKNRKSDAVVRVLDSRGKPVPGAAVEVVQTKQDFLFGCNIFMFNNLGDQARNDLYLEKFKGLFNYATLPFYWNSFEPEKGKPNYPYMDGIVSWCMQNNIRLKGHPLLWVFDIALPRWSQGLPPVDLQKQRVTDIVSRYSGKIDYWEVVNEPSHCYGITIDQPYRWAQEADPKAHLIVNDYNVLADGCPQFFDLLEKAKANGVPFDGIGIQAHEPATMRFPLERVQRVLDKYATLGNKLHITEFTPASSGTPITGSHLTGKWDEAAQADYAAKLYTVCFSHPAMAGITWWDLSDAGSWLEGGGLLRKDLSEKPAYTALRKLIREEWMTRTKGKTDRKGRFKFRGFQGDYTLNVTVGGKTVETSFAVAAAKANAVDVVTR